MNELNKVKKHLGVNNRQLILLATFKMYNKEFDNEEDAIKYILKKIKEATNDKSRND